MKWQETSAGMWVSGDYCIYFGSRFSQRRYDVRFRGTGKTSWAFASLDEAQAFARKHARCWREMKWSKVAPGSWVSDCEHYRARREGRFWRTTRNHIFVQWTTTFRDAQRFAQSESLDRALNADKPQEIIDLTPTIETGVYA